MPSERLTLCVLTAEDETGLGGCLKSASPFVDEIIVGATSKNWPPGLDLAGLDARLVPVSWTGSFAEARNTLLEEVETDGWVLVMDADERLVLPGGMELRKLIAGAEAPAFWVPVHSPGDSAAAGETCIAHQLRLFRNDPAHRYHGALGEELPEALMENAGTAPKGMCIYHMGFGQGEGAWRSRRNLAATESAPANPRLATARGLAMLRQGLADEALNQLEEATSGSGHQVVRAIRWRAWLSLRGGRPEAVLPLLEEGCRQHPAYTDLWFLWGEALAAVGRRAEGEIALKRSLELGPPPPPYESVEGVGDVSPRLVLATLAEQAGRPGEAVQLYTDAYQAAPARTDSLHRLAGALGLDGRGREMAGILRRLVRPATAEQWLLLGDVLTVHRQYRAALRCIDGALASGAAPAELALLRGFCLLQSGRPAETEAALDQVQVPEGDAAWALQLRLLAAWCRWDCPAARRLLEQLGKSGLPVGVKRAARAIHQVLCRSDEPVRPGAAWNQAGGNFLLQAVDALLAAGRQDDARVVGDLIAHAGWQEGYRSLALLCRLRKQHGLAHRYVEAALAAGDRDADLFCMAAELALKARNWPMALSHVWQAVQLAPGNPLPYLLRGRILRAQAVDLLRLARRRWKDPELDGLFKELAGGRHP